MRLAQLHLEGEGCCCVPTAVTEIENSHVWQIANQIVKSNMSSGHYSFQKMWYRNFDPSMYRSKNDNVAIRKPKGAEHCACAGHPRRLVSCVTIKGSTNAANKQTTLRILQIENRAHAKYQGVKEKLTTNHARTAAAYRRLSQQKTDSSVIQDARHAAASQCR
jgi:hypothetical protein